PPRRQPRRRREGRGASDGAVGAGRRDRSRAGCRQRADPAAAAGGALVAARGTARSLHPSRAGRSAIPRDCGDDRGERKHREEPDALCPGGLAQGARGRGRNRRGGDGGAGARHRTGEGMTHAESQDLLLDLAYGELDAVRAAVAGSVAAAAALALVVGNTLETRRNAEKVAAAHSSDFEIRVQPAVPPVVDSALRDAEAKQRQKDEIEPRGLGGVPVAAPGQEKTHDAVAQMPSLRKRGGPGARMQGSGGDAAESQAKAAANAKK